MVYVFLKARHLMCVSHHKINAVDQVNLACVTKKEKKNTVKGQIYVCELC